MNTPKLPLLRKWKEQFWPIKKYELKKILPLFFMKFFISMTYGVLTTMKDAFVVTAKGAGAEVIPVLKGWIVLPVAMGAALIYSRLSNVLTRTKLFNYTILFFMAFIALYGFVLYPNLDQLSPHESADKLMAYLGEQNGHWISIYRNWIQSLFFVMAELWGQIAIFLLFWGFVNHISNLDEAKRSYNLFLAGGDLALIFTGPLVIFLTKSHIGSDFNLPLRKIVCCILFFGVMIISCHAIVNHFIKKDSRLFQPQNNKQGLEQKTKLSLKDSLRFIIQSKPLRYIAVIVVAYGLTINLIEVTWKANLKLVYPDTASYQSFMAGMGTMIGICSLLVSLFFSGVLFRKLGWHFSAQLPPIVIGTTSLIFLVLFLMRNSIGQWGEFSPLSLVVFFGAFQNGISKLMKYTFFDSTKEIAFIPLDQESKVKGKAAIDIVGSRLGKSGAAWIQIILIQLAGTGSVLSITRFLIPIVTFSVLFWIMSVRSLNKQFIAHLENK
ncbi:MAG: Npt1/Npt2 family nucleotide transporter [Rhabdochlamydiaceae bacterium]